MPADFQQKTYVLPRYSRQDYHALMVCWKNISGFEENDVARFRFKVLEHLYQFGWKSACHAFGVKKSAIYDWKGKYEKSKKKLSSLIPHSTRPNHVRSMVVDPKLLEFIKSIREEHGDVSKYKLQIFLDEYAKSIQVPSYKPGKIGKIIKRNKYFFTGKPKHKTRVKLLSPRLKRAPRQTIPGYIEMDSITVWVMSHRYYFVTAIDIATKFAWCKLTTCLSSRQAALALEEFLTKYQYPVTVIQTDNGHEFLGEFDQAVEKLKMSHQFIYPRSPKVNGVVERFNKTIQHEFIERNDEMYMENVDKISQKLADYLIWYNTKRPHYSLKFQTPVQYLQNYLSIPECV
jgi:hypothetical protein